MTPRSFCQIYAQLDQVGDRLPEDLGHLLGLGLVCDASIGLRQAARHREALLALRERGGLVAPNVYPADADPDPACSDPNWWKYPEDRCVELLSRFRERFEALGLGPMKAVNWGRVWSAMKYLRFSDAIFTRADLARQYRPGKFTADRQPISTFVSPAGTNAGQLGGMSC